MAQGKDMQLKVLACRQIYSGRNPRGDEYTIYEVDAERASDGHRIRDKLRCFTALPIGQVVEVTVVPFKSERHGPSFTLYPKGSRSVSSSQQLNEVRDALASLTQRVAVLEARASDNGAQPGELDSQYGKDAPW